MRSSEDLEEKSSLPPEELARRKHQIWLIAGWMVLGFCLAAALLMGVFLLYREPLRQFLISLGG
ncbi:MAG: hypothetical protein ABFD24_02025 [Anaerolineaceae bacterium]